MKKRIAILGSEEKELFLSLIDYMKKHPYIDLVSIIIDRKNALVESLIQLGYTPQIIPNHRISFRKREEYERELLEELIKAQVDWVLLCGYSWILPKIIIKEFETRILNIHPSLLPAFPGAAAIEDAWWWGVKITGVTVHFVDEKVDNGPIILQEAYFVGNKDTQDMIYDALVEIGKKLYKKVVNLILMKKFHLEGRKVIFEGTKW